MGKHTPQSVNQLVAGDLSCSYRDVAPLTHNSQGWRVKLYGPLWKSAFTVEV